MVSLRLRIQRFLLILRHGVQPSDEVGRGCGVSDEAIYRKHRDDLVRYAAALVGPANADDIVSTVVLRTLAHRPLDDLEDARPYLFRAVLNESRSLLSRRPRPILIHAPELAEPELRFEVLAAVLELPAQQRAATYLVYWADLPISEVSNLMGIRPGTVKRYLFLARRSLNGILHDQ